MFVWQKSDNTCGALPSVYSRTYFGLFILALTMIAVFSIKGGLWQAPLTLPLFYIIHTVKENTAVQHDAFNRIPLDIAARVDNKRGLFKPPKAKVDSHGNLEKAKNPYDMISILMEMHLHQEEAQEEEAEEH